MRRREVLIGGGTVAAAALAGCTSRGNPTNSNDDDTGTIAVSGTGETVSEPDLARFHVGIESRDENPDAVRDDIAAREAAVRDALIDAGVDPDDIATAGFQIQEVAESRTRVEEREAEAREREEEADASDDPPEERVQYYEGAHTLRVESEDVDRIGEILDAAIDGGADRVGGIQFTLQDETREALHEEALSSAIGNGYAEAEHIASEIDAEVVTVQHVDASTGRAPVARHHLEVADDTPHAETEIHPDDVSVSVSVEMIVEIR